MGANENGLDQTSSRPVVLLVDDEPMVTRGLRRGLQADYDIRVANSADEALDVVRAEHVDVIVSDERMPGKSGCQLVAEVHAEHPGIVKIILTGHATLDNAVEAINAGRIFGYLIKPSSTEEVGRVIADGLAARDDSHRALELSQRAGDVCSFEWELDEDRLRWSGNAPRLLGRETADLPRDLEGFAALVHPEDREAVRRMHLTCQEGRGGCGMEYRLLLPGGGERWISQAVDLPRPSPGASPRALSVLRDVTRLHRYQERLRHQAFHDELTGLGNRALLLRRLGRALDQPDKRPGVGLLFLDLDDFKTVNDSLGHAVGDRLLAAVAERLANAMPPGGTAMRFGGDEFVVLLEGVGAEGVATDLARRLLESLEAPFSLEGYQLRVTACIGIALAGSDKTSPLGLLREADTAMYMAKARGRGRHMVFSEAMHDEAARRLRLENDMSAGLDTGQFHVAYQPVVRLDNLSLQGFEALARWTHPELGEVPPKVFIPLAESTGLIDRLGRFVMERACRQGAAWANGGSGTPPMISVNLSPRQFHLPEFHGQLRRIIEDTGMDPARLRFEVTESGVMEDVEHSRHVLSGLRELGAKVYIDDFGTGYSSLSHLCVLPVDALKVDRSFVEGMEWDMEKRAIVRAISGLAQSLGMRTVVEGVENTLQLRALRETGCAMAQGFLFSRGLPPEKAMDVRDYSDRLPRVP